MPPNRVAGPLPGYLHGMHGSSEPDVAADPQLARTRETGGTEPEDKKHPHDDEAGSDGASTTGTDENETFVGRVAGDDAGYAGETGAEARSKEDS